MDAVTVWLLLCDMVVVRELVCVGVSVPLEEAVPLCDPETLLEPEGVSLCVELADADWLLVPLDDRVPLRDIV